MHKSDRKEVQDQKDAAIRQARGDNHPITKMDSLFERAKKLGLATDLPSPNRSQRRADLKAAVKEARRAYADH